MQRLAEFGSSGAAAVPAGVRACRKPLRIRTGHSYHVGFTITLGQTNAAFVSRALTPLNRFFTFADSFAFTPEPGFEALHTWNAVPLLTRRPYIVTFEDYLPRTPEDRPVPWLERFLAKSLVSDRCRAIIAISRYAMRQLERQHRNSPYRNALLGKCELIYPAAPARGIPPKTASNTLHLLFVGRDFMRKGGPSVLRAHSRLRRQGVPVETTIVSSLQWSERDYIGPPDRRYVERTLQALSQDGLTHHRSLPAAAVRILMDTADYLVFPTLHDTFGFAAIESLASGTPVIATDTCVLPEIVEHGRNGYLLPFQNDSDVGKWVWLYKQTAADYLDAYHTTVSSLGDALADRLAEAWERRADYEALSSAAIATAARRFNPELARPRLERLYERLADAERGGR